MTRLLVALFALLAVTGSAQELELVVGERTGVHRANGKLTLKPEIRKVVRLGINYFYILEEEKMEVYDLGRERWLQVMKGQRILDVSLSSLVADRHNRLINLSRMVRTLQDIDPGRSGDNATPLFDLESRFGMTAGLPLAHVVQPRPIPPKGMVWTVNNTVLCETKTGATEIPKAFRPIWKAFSAYMFPIHPNVRDRFLREACFPDQLKIRTRRSGRTDLLEWKIQAIRLVNDTAYTEAVRNQAPINSSIPAEALWWRYHTETNRPKRLTRQELNAGFKKSLEYQLYAEALLFALEIAIQEGTSVEEAINALQPALDLDPTLLQIFRGMDIQNEDAALAAVDALRRLQPGSFARGHILHAMRGDAYRAAGKDLDAEKAYLQALQGNPYLTSTYVSLGNLYAEGGHSKNAYLCWELAYKTRSDHSALQAVLERDAKLRVDHPAFFLPKAQR